MNRVDGIGPAGIEYSRRSLLALAHCRWALCLILTAGCSSVGSRVGNGGTVASGGVLGTRGAGIAGGTTENGGLYGASCATNQDCPSDAICCNGSNETCDATRLPSGDGTNVGEFLVSADGLTVTDAITGLVWQRDGVGARPECSGPDLTCTWAEANAYCEGLVLGGFSDWRLPARHELFTIVDLAFGVANPSIDPSVFPDTPSEWFWTASPLAASSDEAWWVRFSDGDLSHFRTGSPFRVRCVRGSRCFPTARFQLLEGGLVRDRLTGLVWQQAASATTISWYDASSYCSAAGPGLRLPTVKELDSIVDLTVASGATINQTAFPNTPAEAFSTSSMHPLLWGFYFDTASTFTAAGGQYRLRCVR